MKSIRNQLLRFLLLGQTLLLLGVVLALYLVMRNALLRQFDQMLEAQADGFISTSELENGVLDFEFSKVPPRSFVTTKHADYFQVWDQHGATLVKSKSLRANSLPTPDLSIRHSPVTDIRLPNGERGRSVIRKFRPQITEGIPEKTAEMTLFMAFSRTELDKNLHIFGGLLLAGAAVLLAGNALMVLWSVRNELRPLDQLAEETSRIDSTHLDFRFATEEAPAELRPIATRLNELLARLNTAFQRERRFSSNVAHELRTPIAELTIIAEVGLTEAHSPVVRDYFTDIKSITHRIGSLVSTLLRIARCEAGTESVIMEPVDLMARLRSIAEKESPIASERGIRVKLPSVEQSFVLADAAVLDAILVNLFSNAALYTPSGGRIECHLQPRASTTVLTIRNTNPGLQESDLPHLLEPFWRADASHTDSAHCGLGLNLVASYARLLSSTLEMRLESPNWVTFFLELRTPSASARPKPQEVAATA
ncbi:MAG: histidine kinase dimerization/phospho-acceptor domain-containing protein [Chthoniobacteraceae bacterium]